MAIPAVGAAVFRRVVNIVGHLIAGVGDNIFSFGVSASAEQKEGDAGG